MCIRPPPLLLRYIFMFKVSIKALLQELVKALLQVLLRYMCIRPPPPSLYVYTEYKYTVYTHINIFVYFRPPP